MAPLRSADDAKVLRRNEACLTCRSRKVRCDADKPSCGACRRSAIAKGEDPNILVCRYDVVEAKTNRKGGNRRVTELEDKIANLERMMEQQNSSAFDISASAPIPVTSYSAYEGSSLDTLAATSSLAFPSTSTDPFTMTAATGLVDMSALSIASATFASSTPPEYQSQLSSEPILQNSTFPIDPYTSSPFNNVSTSAVVSYDDDFMLQLLYPGYPRDLPSPDLLQNLAKIYFSRPHSGTHMINEVRFMYRLSLPPKHSDYPSIALLHGMCAVAYTIGSFDGSGASDYWRQDNDEEITSPALYHAKKAKRYFETSIEKGEKLFDLCQAVVLLNFFSYTHARFVEVWINTGLVVRLATPLGLNHLETSYTDQNGQLSTDTREVPGYSSQYTKKYIRQSSRQGCLIPPPEDEADRFSRAVTFWMCYMSDRLATANTSFAPCIVEADISTLLPNSQCQTGPLRPAFLHAETLSPHSDVFFVSHQTGGVFALYIKSIVLMGRVTDFIQRSPYPIGRSQKHYANPKKGKDRSCGFIRNSMDFRQLDSDCVAFRLSFFKDYKALLNKGSFTGNIDDHHLVMAHAIGHVSTILLNEPFCTTAPGDASLAATLSSARAILCEIHTCNVPVLSKLRDIIATIYLLVNSAYDLALFHPFAIFTWQVAARAITREYAIKLHQASLHDVIPLPQEITVVLGAMQGMRNQLAAENAANLRKLLDNSAILVPPRELDGITSQSSSTYSCQDPYAGHRQSDKAASSTSSSELFGASPTDSSTSSSSASGKQTTSSERLFEIGDTAFLRMGASMEMDWLTNPM